MPVLLFQFAFAPGLVSPAGLLDKAADLLEGADLSLADFSWADRLVDLRSAAEMARRSKRRSFSLRRQDAEVHFDILANCEIDVFRLSVPDVKFDANICGGAFADEPGFVMGWLVDREYDYWQNAEDLLEYRAAGRDFSGLPLRKRDLPPPLDDLIVDTSDNPGRYALRTGFVEAVGSRMWLGDRFWNVTGALRKKVLQARWLLATELGSGVIAIEASQAPFRSADGDSGVTQRRLRSLLFDSKLR